MTNRDMQEFEKELKKIMVKFNRAVNKETGARFSVREMQVLALTSWAEDAFLLSNPIDEESSCKNSTDQQMQEEV